MCPLVLVSFVKVIQKQIALERECPIAMRQISRICLLQKLLWTNKCEFASKSHGMLIRLRKALEECQK